MPKQCKQLILLTEIILETGVSTGNFTIKGAAIEEGKSYRAGGKHPRILNINCNGARKRAKRIELEELLQINVTT